MSSFINVTSSGTGQATVELHLDEEDGTHTVIDIGHLCKAARWSKKGDEPAKLTLECVPGVARSQLAAELPNGCIIVAEADPS